jgi:CheY-like chemotaxis protein
MELEAAFTRLKTFTKPRTKRLLIVEDNEIERSSIVELLGYKDIELMAVGSGSVALALLREQPIDCVVLDLRLPDMSGFELLEQMHAEPALTDTPVVVFTGKELSAEEQARLKAMAKSIVLKRRCSCTAWSRTCPLPSRRCSSSCMAAAKCCADARCWWSMMMRVTSSP